MSGDNRTVDNTTQEQDLAQPLCDCAINRPRYLEGTPYEYQCVLHRRQDPDNGTPPAHLPALVKGRTIVFAMDKPEDWEDLDDGARQARRREALTKFAGTLGLWFEEDGSVLRKTSELAVYRNDYYGHFEILEHNEYDDFYWHGQTMIKSFLLTRKERRQLPVKVVNETELALGLRESVWQEYVKAKLKPLVQADQKARHPRLTREYVDRLMRKIEDPDGDVSCKDSDWLFKRLMAPRYGDPATPSQIAFAARLAEQRQRSRLAARNTASSTPPSRPATPNVSVPAQGRAKTASVSPRSTPVFPARPQNASQGSRPIPQPGPGHHGRPSVHSTASSGESPAPASQSARTTRPKFAQRLAALQRVQGGPRAPGHLSPHVRPADRLQSHHPPRTPTTLAAQPNVPQHPSWPSQNQAAHMPVQHRQGSPLVYSPPVHVTGQRGQNQLPVQQGSGLQTQQQGSPYERGHGHLPPPYVRPSPYAPDQASSAGVMSPYLAPGRPFHPDAPRLPPGNMEALSQYPHARSPQMPYSNPNTYGMPMLPRQPTTSIQHGQPAGAGSSAIGQRSPGANNQQGPIWDPVTGQYVLQNPHARYQPQ